MLDPSFIPANPRLLPVFVIHDHSSCLRLDGGSYHLGNSETFPQIPYPPSFVLWKCRGNHLVNWSPQGLIFPCLWNHDYPQPRCRHIPFVGCPFITLPTLFLPPRRLYSRSWLKIKLTARGEHDNSSVCIASIYRFSLTASSSSTSPVKDVGDMSYLQNSC